MILSDFAELAKRRPTGVSRRDLLKKKAWGTPQRIHNINIVHAQTPSSQPCPRIRLPLFPRKEPAAAIVVLISSCHLSAELFRGRKHLTESFRDPRESLLQYYITYKIRYIFNNIFVKYSIENYYFYLLKLFM